MNKVQQALYYYTEPIKVKTLTSQCNSHYSNEIICLFLHMKMAIYLIIRDIKCYMVELMKEKLHVNIK